MSTRLHFIVEGQTEEIFVNRILAPELGKLSVWCKSRCVTTSRKRGKKYRGGLQKYAKARNDILLWMKEDKKPDAFFTTMFDLYGLPEDFPDYEKSRKITAPYKRVNTLETAIKEDINDPRFMPYIQLHEFEALIFVDPGKLQVQFPERGKEIEELVELASGMESPEFINDGAESAPSKRIIKLIPEYEGMKASAGPLVVNKIGLPAIRSKCKHFDEWLNKLTSLADTNKI